MLILKNLYETYLKCVQDIFVYIFQQRQLDPDDIVHTPTLKTLYIFNEAIKTLQEFE